MTAGGKKKKDKSAFIYVSNMQSYVSELNRDQFCRDSQTNYIIHPSAKTLPYTNNNHYKQSNHQNVIITGLRIIKLHRHKVQCFYAELQ